MVQTAKYLRFNLQFAWQQFPSIKKKSLGIKRVFLSPDSLPQSRRHQCYIVINDAARSAVVTLATKTTICTFHLASGSAFLCASSN
jgi:hypothetical protein